MAFALTKFQAWGAQLSETSTKRAKQFAELTITSLAADVAMDLGTDAGTFWTAAIANTTYGVVASSALATLQKIDDFGQLVGCDSEQLIDRVKVLALAAVQQYTLTVVNHRPNLAFTAGDGEVAWKILLEWSLPDGNTGYTAQFG